MSWLTRKNAVVEDDPETGKCVVGRGGLPNACGILECDAAVMDGNGCRFGAVTAIQGIATPFSIARLVMEKSPHSMLTGVGAQDFARQCGITIIKNEELQTEYSKASYQDFLAKSSEGGSHEQKTGHDTIGLIVKDFEGNIAAGTSTSGKPFKFSGRVGDSALPGAGLYADNQAGAAAATGDGDNILRFCPCFKVVQLMKQGLTPKEACRRVIKDIWKTVGKENMFDMALIAVNTGGECGVASNVESSPGFGRPELYLGFAYCHWSSDGGDGPKTQCEPPVVWQNVENDT